MNGEDIGYMIGYGCVSVLFALIPIRFLREAWRARTTSLRLAQLALFCGLSWLIVPQLNLELENRALSVMLATARFFLGAAGIVLAVVALFYRMKDRGTGVGRPVIGLGLSALVMLGGCAMMIFPLITPAAVDPATAWTYTHPTHNFQVQLPSGRWRSVATTNAEADFGCAQPHMQCRVVTVKTGQTQADFQAAVQKHREYLESSPLRKSTGNHREGSTAQGNPYIFSTCMDNATSGGQVFVASSLVFCRAKGLVVQMLFEGQSRMASQAGQRAEKKSFESAAEYILLSVK